MGSANINDRSQKVSTYILANIYVLTWRSKGDGDSEIALVVEDDDMIETTMDGQRYVAGRFAATLRRKLYKGSIRPHSPWRFSYLIALLYPQSTSASSGHRW